jgi:hypothetical protein
LWGIIRKRYLNQYFSINSQQSGTAFRLRTFINHVRSASSGSPHHSSFNFLLLFFRHPGTPSTELADIASSTAKNKEIHPYRATRRECKSRKKKRQQRLPVVLSSFFTPSFVDFYYTVQKVIQPTIYAITSRS